MQFLVVWIKRIGIAAHFLFHNTHHSHQPRLGLLHRRSDGFARTGLEAARKFFRHRHRRRNRCRLRNSVCVCVCVCVCDSRFFPTETHI